MVEDVGESCYRSAYCVLAQLTPPILTIYSKQETVGKRFTSSVNHPDIYGWEARYTAAKGQLPREPMYGEEADQFIRLLVNRWLLGKE